MTTDLNLINRQSPGDGLIMTAAIRDLHLTYPGEYRTSVESPFPEVYAHNPYLVPIEPNFRFIEMHYPLIHNSGRSGRHFTEGYRDYLAEQISRPITTHSMLPEIHLTNDERAWPNPLFVEHGYEGPYWVINAGIKTDFTLKQYPYYQEVVDLLRDTIQFVQVGHTAHDHPPLDGVLDLRGKTNLRQLFRLSWQADGAVCAVSLQMVVMGAFEKPAVIVSGGREGVRWQRYSFHRFMDTIGLLDCCRLWGCWKSKPTDCADWLQDAQTPHCMEMIRPEAIASEIMRYYEGGVLKRQEEEVYV